MSGSDDRVRIRVNGQPEAVTTGTTLVDLLASRRLDGRFLVVEYNGEPLARERFAEVVLRPGDRLELVRPVAGG
jgi:sulfur carrier protein